MVSSIPAGSRLLAEDLLEWSDQIDSLTDPGWTSFTPTWTSTGTAPAIGNGTRTGRYRRSAGGDIVHFEIFFRAGSTTTFGTGEWRFSIPVAADATSVNGTVGAALILDSGLQTRMAVWHFITSTTVAPDTASGTVTNTSPQTWANGDELRISGFYVPA